ncbi:DUF4395 domain-containing protein [Salinibaculum salinum]|uniref:DUF4395 domain-containing protein n=1 Tax=Salinibaculum salinum TaxID=3131996 RepID=UPI0030EE168B
METPTHTEQSQSTAPVDGPALVDPRAPRFGQSLTALTLVAAIALQLPVFVYALAVLLSAAVISGWRIDAYALLWRHGALRLLDPPTAREPAAPHRFARVIGAVFTTGASVALLAGLPVVGYALAGLVAALAGLAATTGFCLGCRMYRQVQFFQRLGIV